MTEMQFDALGSRAAQEALITDLIAQQAQVNSAQTWGQEYSQRCQPPFEWVWFHPEITPLSNFHQLRDTTDSKPLGECLYRTTKTRS